MLKKDLKQRSTYLDFMKILAIYFVCFYHYNNLNIDFLTTPSFSTYLNYFVKGIASTGVPLFFMVNGALMLNRNYNLNKHIKKIINIVVLTIIWGFITLLILSIINKNIYPPLRFLAGLWTWVPHITNHLWFLTTLVCIYILFPLIKTVYDLEDKKILNYILITIFIFTFGNVILNIIVNTTEYIFKINHLTHSRFNFFNHFNLFQGFYAYSLVYFIIGGLIFKKLKGKISINKNKYIVFFIVGLGLLFLNGVMMSKSNEAIYDTVWNGYDTIMTLLICISIFLLTYSIENKLNKISNIIQLIGENTLGIYFLHRFVGSILIPYYIKLNFNTSLLLNLLFGFATMFISLIITLILKKIPVVKFLFKI